MQGSKKYHRRWHRDKYYQIQIWSDKLEEWLWVGRFIKEDWDKHMPNCVEKYNLLRNGKNVRKKAGHFFLDDKVSPQDFFRNKLSEYNDVSNFWSQWMFNPKRKPPNPIDFYNGYSQIRFITLDNNKYYLFKLNPIKLRFGVKEYMLVKINKFNKNNAKLV